VHKTEAMSQGGLETRLERKDEEGVNLYIVAGEGLVIIALNCDVL